MRRIAVLLTLILACVSSFASTVTFTINLQDYSLTPVHSYLIVTLKTSGSCIPSTSSGTIGVASVPYFPPTGSGTVTLTLDKNADITCGSVSNTTYYLFDVYERGINGAADKKVFSGTYQVVDLFNITTAGQFNTAPPPPLVNYAVRNGNNTFLGIEDFTGATVLGISGSAILQRTITGTVNGANTIFTLPSAPPTGGLLLLENGLMLTSGAGKDFIITGNTITFSLAPANGTQLLAFY